MKNRKLLVPVRCTSRKFYLAKIAGRNDWHIRFTGPTHERITRNTGTKEPDAAKRIAADIIESFWNDAGRGAEALKLRSNYATIGELIERYVECAQERPRTVRSNVQSLRAIVATVHKGTVLTQSTALLTDELIREFERRRIGYAIPRGPVAVARARNSTASYLRQARSIVAPRKMKFYKGMKLPDLTLFRAECVQTPVQPMPRPLDMNALAAMEAAAPALAVSDPAVYVAHLLFSRLGLRNIEILHARWEWITDGRIGIIERPEEDFSPKGCEGYVPIAPDVLAELARFRGAGEGRCYLVPGSNATGRHAAIYRRHSRWVSTWIKDRTKTSYELRRYAGSRLLDMGASIFEVRDFLRHRDVQTSQKWYAYRLQNRELRTIGMRDLLPASAA